MRYANVCWIGLDWTVGAAAKYGVERRLLDTGQAVAHTRSQAVDRRADRTASHQTIILVISDCC